MLEGLQIILSQTLYFIVELKALSLSAIDFKFMQL